MVIFSLIFCLLGDFNPMHRAYLYPIMAFVYVCCGILNGIVFGQVYRSFGGDSFFKAAALNSFVFPMFLMILLTVIEICDWVEKSVYVVPFSFITKVILVWNLVNSITVFLSSGIAYKASKSHQNRVNRISKDISVQPTQATFPVTIVIGSLLCFLAIGIEFFYLIISVWHEEYYKMYFFLLISLIVLTVTASMVSILQTYVMLSNGNYEWHWRAYNVGAAVSVYLFIISVYLYIYIDGTMNFGTSMIYLSTIIICCAVFSFMTGHISFFSSFMFVSWLYRSESSVKADVELSTTALH
mmetsp:Transcript_1058/g.695  ORF Transcript_1058/g.695 Transcript_1058/m.695 type:complete len:298 (-) Transcript_1058:75-968(-)